MIDTMFKIVDPFSASFTRFDQNIYNLNVNVGERLKQCMMVQFHPDPLLRVLEQFAENYELVIYTVLPRKFLD